MVGGGGAVGMCPARSAALTAAVGAPLLRRMNRARFRCDRGLEKGKCVFRDVPFELVSTEEFVKLAAAEVILAVAKLNPIKRMRWLVEEINSTGVGLEGNADQHQNAIAMLHQSLNAAFRGFEKSGKNLPALRVVPDPGKLVCAKAEIKANIEFISLHNSSPGLFDRC